MPTPGVVFLARGALSLVFPGALTAAVLYILDAHYGVSISIGHLALAAAVLAPTAVVAKHWLGILHTRRRAAALGARLAPKLTSGGIGNFGKLMEMVKSMEGDVCGGVHEGWVQECGNTLNPNILWEDSMFTTEPDHIKAILATDFPNYIKGEQFQDGFRGLLGTGVFNSDGDMWKFHRSMTRPFFTRDRISEFDNFDRHADAMIRALKARLRAGHPVDFQLTAQDAVGRFTLDAASEFLLGTDVASLADPLPLPFRHAPADGGSGADAFVRAFAAAQVVAVNRSMRRWAWPLAEVWADAMAPPMRVVSAFLDPIVERAVARRAAVVAEAGEKKGGAGEVAEGATLLDHLVTVTTDRKVLKDEILNILIAGRDTVSLPSPFPFPLPPSPLHLVVGRADWDWVGQTAATLTFAWYLLSQHPGAMARLRAEVLEHVGASARPTYAVLANMKYLRAFINGEPDSPIRHTVITIRLFFYVRLHRRSESVHESTWPSSDPTQKPIYIPAKAPIFYSTILTHRRTDLWGPDANEFDPDRFLDERVRTYLTPKPYIFVPFNAGPRICLGQQFAYNEISFVLIRLLQSFASVTLNSAAQPPDTVPPAAWAGAAGRKGVERVWPQSHLTIFARGGLWVNMEEAALE
ncbi:hypothetical protein HWV62_27478 [Athelia sp. TMB]|nr:hypothetical protein HWV62_27478 [Athelia sp. TMB]